MRARALQLTSRLETAAHHGNLLMTLRMQEQAGQFDPGPPGSALERYFAPWISGAILFSGYIVAGVDSPKAGAARPDLRGPVIYAG
jgi:hypothetical protein